MGAFRLRVAVRGPDPIGHGGWGDVYFGKVQERQVAVKFLNGEHGAHRDRQRFMHEFELLRSLDHSSLVRVFDSGEWNGRLYYTMERVQGSDFLQYVNAHPERLHDLFAQLLEALAYIHSRGIVHRDLKPENLLVDADGKVRVIDFGISQHVEHPVHFTRTGALLGTPAYMAPEQVRGDKLDARSDLYSAGVVLYRAYTGKTPFEGADITSLLYKIVYEEPDLTAIPKPVRCMLAWLLQKDPDKRPQSADEALATWQGPAPSTCPDEVKHSVRRIPAASLWSFVLGFGSAVALLSLL
jgi:eukaryotic-like serine/threonine-protein kinase